MEELENKFSEIAALLGDRARSLMLWSLLDGRAYTASELALSADLTLQAASNHLAKLTEAKLLTVERQGRHRYFRFASPETAHVIESMASLVTLSSGTTKKSRQIPTAIGHARTCYDHLAGKFGVAVTEALLKNRYIFDEYGKYVLTEAGIKWFENLGIAISDVRKQKRSFAYLCLDWSERKHHLAGALGAALLNALLENDWIRCKKNSREVIVTLKGEIELRKQLNIIL